MKASLPEGGIMYIENDDMESEFVEWTKTKVDFDENYNPISLLYQINEFSTSNNLIILSEILPLNIYYTIFTISESKTNFVNYAYNPPE